MEAEAAREPDRAVRNKQPVHSRVFHAEVRAAR